MVDQQPLERTSFRSWLHDILQSAARAVAPQAPQHGPKWLPTIQLSSGRTFNFESPSALTIEEIASALSKICRFTGQCEPFYSVAQHAVHTSYLVDPRFAWEALHHDDVEAVVNDMASPLKRLIPEYKRIEHRCEVPILAAFGIDANAMPVEVKQADLRALRTEQRDLMVPNPVQWQRLDATPDPRCIVPVSPEVAKRMFLARYYELAARRARHALTPRHQELAAA
jgi:uncharacterized protein